MNVIAMLRNMNAYKVVCCYSNECLKPEKKSTSKNVRIDMFMEMALYDGDELAIKNSREKKCKSENNRKVDCSSYI